MQITKYVHSCLLVEHDGYAVLFDPGEYSYDSHLLDLSSLSKLDVVIITHEHQDHYHVPFLQDILRKFPQVQIVTNTELAQVLKQVSPNVNNAIPSWITSEEVVHERVFGVSEMPQNSLFTVFNTLTHPGDSFSFHTSSSVLALPLQAPWGDVTEAVELAEKLAPKIIIPIHDWHWKDEARKGVYARLEQYFLKQGIRFLNIESGQTVTLEV